MGTGLIEKSIMSKEIIPSLRTASLLPTDWEFALIGLNESIKCSNCDY